MTTSKLPARPSLESLRKQAKQLARSIAAGDATAIARARDQLPQAELPLSQREAQLVLAREYGFPGWKDLLKEVKQRLGRGLEWAVSEARRIIHDNDVEGLRQLLVDYPALLSWKADENDGGLLALATGSYGDSGDAFREEHFTRLACAELLLDAGAVVAPCVSDGIIASRARGLIALFHRRGLFPRSLKFVVALGDIDGVRAFLDTNSDDLAAVSEACLVACHLEHAKIAVLLLDRCITLDSELGRRIDGGPGRSGFIQAIRETSLIFSDAEPEGLWQEFVMREVVRAEHDGDLADFRTWFRREPNVQQVLDTAFAWAVINNHFEIADFLLVHGADINTKWSSHEPASILHELVWRKNYEAMQFLIDRGIDMTIHDYRWGSTPEGWATYFGDEKMTQWLRDAQHRRESSR
jgi:hypothetical protein